jgi:hypothetical protein
VTANEDPSAAVRVGCITHGWIGLITVGKLVAGGIQSLVALTYVGVFAITCTFAIHGPDELAPLQAQLSTWSSFEECNWLSILETALASVRRPPA